MAAARIELVPETEEQRTAREARFAARKAGMVQRAAENDQAKALKALDATERAAVHRDAGEAAAWHVEQGGRVVAYGNSASTDAGLMVLDGAVVVGPLAAGKPLTLRVGKGV